MQGSGMTVSFGGSNYGQVAGDHAHQVQNNLGTTADELQKQIAAATHKHDPVANGECAACHNPHQADEPALLSKDRRKVCFECHEENDMATVKAHASAPQESCVTCHDPHSGKDKYFLKSPKPKN